MTRKTNPEFYNQKAHATREIKFLLLDFFQFRAYIVFNNRKKFSPYGNEHQCTYNQILAGRFSSIKLDRLKGYTDLIRLIEVSYKGKYSAATIYRRDDETKEFDHTCRRYDATGIQELNDPVITEADQFRTLYYTIQNGRVIIQEEDPNAHDFKNLVNQNL